MAYDFMKQEKREKGKRETVGKQKRSRLQWETVCPERTRLGITRLQRLDIEGEHFPSVSLIFCWAYTFYTQCRNSLFTCLFVFSSRSFIRSSPRENRTETRVADSLLGTWVLDSFYRSKAKLPTILLPRGWNGKCDSSLYFLQNVILWISETKLTRVFWTSNMDYINVDYNESMQKN